MSIRRSLGRAAGLAGSLIAGAALAHPGHGAPQDHVHGVAELVVLLAAVAAAAWLPRSRR